MRTFSALRAMQEINFSSKFRGSILGGLIGDCYGGPYEGAVLSDGDKAVLRRTLNQLEGPLVKAPAKNYSDDSAMTKSVLQCLITHKDIDSKELAKSFVREYTESSNRGYGAAVTEVFHKLFKSKFEDVLTPAQEQFGGRGSYGNGAAMRVSPIGLFCHNEPQSVKDLAKKSAVITHTHPLGVNGAILQALAVSMCVKKYPTDFSASEFLDELTPTIESIEAEDQVVDIRQQGPNFRHQLSEVRRLLQSPIPVSDDDVLNTLGHEVTAIFSVPTAVYIFLRAQGPIAGIESENPFRRTLEYAISLGGDTDTIASMACSLTGALHGDAVIPQNLIKHCEAHEEFSDLANKLYEACL